MRIWDTFEKIQSHPLCLHNILYIILKFLKQCLYLAHISLCRSKGLVVIYSVLLFQQLPLELELTLLKTHHTQLKINTVSQMLTMRRSLY